MTDTVIVPNSRRGPLALLLAGMAVATVACAGEDQTPRRDSPEVMDMRKQAGADKPFERLEPEEEPVGVIGEVPDELLERMRADLAGRTGGAAAELLVAESVVWPDGSMGCPRPGQTYTQSLVPGYRVVFESGGGRWHYHASESGYFELCDSPEGVGRPGLDKR